MVKRSNTNFLGEDLKAVIDKIVLASNFFDIDRPLRSGVDLQKMAEMETEWTKDKEQF